jgi:drug/metabolite transporter (DMT)-like permease
LKAADLERLAPNVRGALWLLASALAMSIQSAAVKWVGESIHSFQITFLRGALGLVLIAPILVREGGLRLGRSRLRLHFARAGAGVLSMGCSFYAYTHMPLAEATALTFTMPLFLVVLAVILLRETVGWRRWSATAVGFVGVLVMLRPFDLSVELAALVALVSAFFHALVGILIKRLSATETVATMMFWFAAFATLGFLIPAIRVWVTPGPWELFLISVIAVFGVGSQLCFIYACRIAEMTAMAPFDYTRLLFTGVLGWLIFAELPDGWSLTGAAIIAASTLYILRREARLARQGPEIRRP